MDTLHSHEVRSVGRTDADREAILQQLERMVADPLFRNSKRFPSLLRYVVEHTLDGRSSELKERTLGVEVFGRQPHYDTNSDPIVRATAGEVRKRIAQYYQNPDHGNQVRILLSPGSYVPEFETRETHHPVIIQPEPAPAPAPAPSTHRYSFWRLVAVIAVCAVASLLLLVKPWHSRSPLDQFWAPVLNSSNSVLLCIGQKSFMATAQEPMKPPNDDVPPPVGPAGTIKITDMYYMGNQNVVLDDAKTLARLAGLLQVKGKNYHILGGSSASFADLRQGPVILIGGFNNDWTLRLTGPLRFSFERDGTKFWIRDRQNPAAQEHSVNFDTPYLQLKEDYALISRVLDPMTERMVVVAAGITGCGTVAAGEFLSDPVYMAAAAKLAPEHWDGKNMQLVIATKVISGNSGPPRVIDRYFW